MMSEGHFISWKYLYRDCSQLLRSQWTWKGVVVTQAGDSEMRTTLESRRLHNNVSKPVPVAVVFKLLNHHVTDNAD